MRMRYGSKPNRNQEDIMKRFLFLAAFLCLTGCSCNDIGYCPVMFPRSV
jgi:hypothetical protein